MPTCSNYSTTNVSQLMGTPCLCGGRPWRSLEDFTRPVNSLRPKRTTLVRHVGIRKEVRALKASDRLFYLKLDQPRARGAPDTYHRSRLRHSGQYLPGIAQEHMHITLLEKIHPHRMRTIVTEGWYDFLEAQHSCFPPTTRIGKGKTKIGVALPLIFEGVTQSTPSPVNHTSDV